MKIGDDAVRIRMLNRLWFLVGIKECLASLVFVCLYFFLFWHCAHHAVTGIYFAVHLRCRTEETQNLSIIVCHECNLTLEATHLIFLPRMLDGCRTKRVRCTSFLHKHSSRKPELSYNDARAEPPLTTSSSHNRSLIQF